MTIAGALLDDLRRQPLPVPVTDRAFRIDDQTQLSTLVSWQAEPTAAPTLVLLHGLTGSADAGYMRSTTIKLFRAGFNVVRVNIRNCGGTEALTPTLYHTGLTEDLRAILSTLREEGHRSLYVAGFSMGGNMLLKLLGEWGAQTPAEVKGGVAISPPINLAAASKALNEGLFNKLYQRNFLSNLKAFIRRKAALFPQRYDTQGLDQIRTLREFDDAYIAPCFGFKSADDYYARASAGPQLNRINVPLLVLAARDDSIIPIEDFERWQRTKPPHIDLIITDHGGHAGFIAKATNADPDRFWAENRLVDYLSKLAF